jgi:hypothetical protein
MPLLQNVFFSNGILASVIFNSYTSADLVADLKLQPAPDSTDT